MTAERLKRLVLSLTQDIEFEYQGKQCSIIPISATSISVSFGPDNTKDYDGVDKMMSDPMWDGASLNDIAQKIVLY